MQKEHTGIVIDIEAVVLERFDLAMGKAAAHVCYSGWEEQEEQAAETFDRLNCNPSGKHSESVAGQEVAVAAANTTAVGMTSHAY